MAQKQFTKDVDAAAHEAVAYKDPFMLLKFLKEWWISHLKKEHLEYATSLDKLKEKNED
jgi:hypothetical protein